MMVVLKERGNLATPVLQPCGGIVTIV